jgi:hypothetical protein
MLMNSPVLLGQGFMAEVFAWEEGRVLKPVNEGTNKRNEK